MEKSIEMRGAALAVLLAVIAAPASGGRAVAAQDDDEPGTMRSGMWRQEESFLFESATPAADARRPPRERRRIRAWLAQMNRGYAVLSGVTRGTHICVDDALRERMRAALTREPYSCTNVRKTRIAGGYRFEATCRAGEPSRHPVITVSGDLDSAFTTVQRVVPQLHAPPTKPRLTIRLAYRYAGPCSDDMQPGDVKVQHSVPRPMDAGEALHFLAPG